MNSSATSRTSRFCSAALAYAQQGWPVFPVRPSGKEPITKHGHKDATTDPQQVRDWWRRTPAANVAISVPDETLVLDVDSDDALHALKHQDLSLPTTVTATTGRGLHFWYRTVGFNARNKVSLLPGVDVRSRGGYVVVPPSHHPNGGTYEWRVPLSRSSIAEAPEWLLSRLQETVSVRSHGRRDWSKTISQTVHEGERNQRLAEVAGYLFYNLPTQIAADLAHCWCQVRMSPPLPADEIQRTLDSIATRELRQRRGSP